MEIKVLASSSKGNCYHISDGSSQILIEAGIKLQDIRAKGVNLAELDGCLITHEHLDHSKYAKEIAKYTDIYASTGTLSSVDLGVFNYRKNIVKVGDPFKIKTFITVPFEVQHDANEPLGFLIYSSKTNDKLLFATDTYYIKSRFKGLNYIMVECNYSNEIVKRNLEAGMHEIRVKRLFTSHFELENVIKFLLAQDLSKVKAIYLMHLSDGNSDAKLFKEAVQKATGKVVIVCES